MKKDYKPKRSKENPRKCRLAISVTPEEKQILQERASSVDLKVSEYLYNVSLNRTLKMSTKQVRQDMRELLGCANNWNQLGKTANKYGILGKEDIDKLKNTVDLIYNTITETI